VRNPRHLPARRLIGAPTPEVPNIPHTPGAQSAPPPRTRGRMDPDATRASRRGGSGEPFSGCPLVERGR